MPRSFASRTSPSSSAKWKIAVLLGLALVLILAAGEIKGLLGQMLDAIHALGAWGPVLFIVVYGLATVALVPGSLLTLFAGASFGVFWGSIWTSLAATFGASLAFLVGRYFARSWVAEKIEGNETFIAIDEAVAKDGWKIVGLTRLSPVFPFTLLNYAFGLTRVSFKHYVLASWIGMIPGTILYVYIGSIGQAVTGDTGKTTEQWVLFGVGLVATLVVTVMITRTAKRALQAKL